MRNKRRIMTRRRVSLMESKMQIEKLKMSKGNKKIK